MFWLCFFQKDELKFGEKMPTTLCFGWHPLRPRNKRSRVRGTFGINVGVSYVGNLSDVSGKHEAFARYIINVGNLTQQ